MMIALQSGWCVNHKLVDNNHRRKDAVPLAANSTRVEVLRGSMKMVVVDTTMVWYHTILP